MDARKRWKEFVSFFRSLVEGRYRAIQSGQLSEEAKRHAIELAINPPMTRFTYERDGQPAYVYRQI